GGCHQKGIRDERPGQRCGSRATAGRPVPYALLVPRTLDLVRVGNTDRLKTASTLLRLLGAGVVAGVLVAFIALPAVGSAGITARDAANNFEDMDGHLETDPPSEKTVVYDSDGNQIATFFEDRKSVVRL